MVETVGSFCLTQLLFFNASVSQSEDDKSHKPLCFLFQRVCYCLSSLLGITKYIRSDFSVGLLFISLNLPVQKTLKT